MSDKVLPAGRHAEAMSEDSTGEWPEGFELQSEAVKECAESIIDDPDSGIDDKSTAFATCQAMENRGQLKEPEGRENAAEDYPFRHLSTDHPMDPPGSISKVEEDDGSVRYRNVLILGPGEWVDGHTEQPAYYSPELTNSIADNPDELVPVHKGRRLNIINFNHEGKQNQQKQVGHFDPDTLQTDQHGNLYADVIYWNDTSASQDAVALMDRSMKTNGQQGLAGFSVEVGGPDEVTEFNRDRGMEEIKRAPLTGLALVTDSASEPAMAANQFTERAVALSADGRENVRILYPATDQTALSGARHGDGMDGPITELDELKELGDDAELFTPLNEDIDMQPFLLSADGETVSIDIEGASIEDIRDALAPSKEMQGDDEVAAAVDEYLASDGSPEDGVDQFLEWAQANLDMDMDVLEAAAADYLAESGAEDLSQTPVSEFMAFLTEEEAGGGEEEEGNPSDDELSALVEENRELRAIVDDQAETLETVTERLETLEDRPDYGEPPEADDDAEPAGPAPVRDGLAHDGDYFTR